MGVINARSKDEILVKYPRLKVIDDRPAWISDAEYRNIASTDTYDVDHQPTGWLANMTKPE
jgi:hypothetical protein